MGKQLYCLNWALILQLRWWINPYSANNYNRLNLLGQGVPTLWGSFEIKNVQLVKQMLQQYYKFGHLNALKETELEQVNIANDISIIPVNSLTFIFLIFLFRFIKLLFS